MHRPMEETKCATTKMNVFFATLRHVDEQESRFPFKAIGMEEQENVAAVIFYANGPDSTILSLPDVLGCTVYGSPLRIGDPHPDGQGVVDFNYVAVTLVPECVPIEESTERLAQWLRQHSDCLSRLVADKTLEFQTYITPGIGSKFLHIPLDVIRLCSEIECKITHQYFRVLTETEVTSRKPQG